MIIYGDVPLHHNTQMALVCSLRPRNASQYRCGSEFCSHLSVGAFSSSSWTSLAKQFIQEMELCCFINPSLIYGVPFVEMKNNGHNPVNYVYWQNSVTVTFGSELPQVKTSRHRHFLLHTNLCDSVYGRKSLHWLLNLWQVLLKIMPMELIHIKMQQDSTLYTKVLCEEMPITSSSFLSEERPLKA